MKKNTLPRQVEFRELKNSTFVGVSLKQRIGARNNVPSEWVKRKADGTMASLLALPNRIFGEALLGWMGNFVASTKEFEYCMGVVVTQSRGDHLPPPFKRMTLPDCLLAIGTISTGPQGAHAKNKKLYEREGYELDFSKGFEMEYYEGEKPDGIFKYCTPVIQT